METDAPSPTSTLPPPLLHEPFVIGTLCGLISAIGYTAANSCLCAVADCPSVWVAFTKAFPTVALFGPLLLSRIYRNQEQLPKWRQLRVLIFAAAVCQLFGNVVFQWSLGAIGMALTVPLTLGTMISGAALMGRLWLREPVTWAMAGSMAVLIAAIFVLSSGAKEAADARSQARQNSSIASPHEPTERRPPPQDERHSNTTHHEPGIASAPQVAAWQSVLLGVGAACLAGLAYAFLGVSIRSVVTASTSLWMTTVTVTSTGLVTLGTLGCFTPGLAAWKGISGGQMGIMLAAGGFNALAFLSLTKALQLVPVAHVNALNASQAAMGALAGVLFFSEPSSWQLWAGVGLTAIGLTTMRRPQSGEKPKSR